MKSTGLLTELNQLETIRDLTAVFESITSIRIAKVKDRVAHSQRYFDELWRIYTQLRVDPKSRLGTRPVKAKNKKPHVLLVLTSEGGLSGDIDDRIVREVVGQYNPADTDLIVVGSHGNLLLQQHGITPARFFRLPDTDSIIDVSPLVAELVNYSQPTVFYQSYVSLAIQEIKHIELLARVQTLSEGKSSADTISPKEYLFEPNIDEVAEYLESVMVGVAISQLILESRLAQYASRFTAMYRARESATDMVNDEERLYHKARRNEADERTKEIINAMVVLA